MSALCFQRKYEAFVFFLRSPFKIISLIRAQYVPRYDNSERAKCEAYYVYDEQFATEEVL